MAVPVAAVPVAAMAVAMMTAVTAVAAGLAGPSPAAGTGGVRVSPLQSMQLFGTYTTGSHRESADSSAPTIGEVLNKAVVGKA
mmetsp:Transcript_69438/g.96520  ORF Transcript_69438/g.96520 Transcript_69438/m.96520 type:complete len:83 (-) Transcript_69438:1479-1727(-)